MARAHPAGDGRMARIGSDAWAQAAKVARSFLHSCVADCLGHRLLRHVLVILRPASIEAAGFFPRPQPVCGRRGVSSSRVARPLLLGSAGPSDQLSGGTGSPPLPSFSDNPAAWCGFPEGLHRMGWRGPPSCECHSCNPEPAGPTTNPTAISFDWLCRDR